MIAKKIVLATLGAALIAGAAIPALAAPGPGPGRGGPEHGAMGPMGHGLMQDVMFVRLLKVADGNKDGKISKEEMTAFQDKLFSEIDANKDGSLTRGEMLDYRQAKLEEFRKNNPPPAAGDENASKPDDRRGDHNRDREQAGRDRHHDRQGDRHGWNRDDRGPGWGRQDARWDRHDRRGDRPMMGGGMFRMIDEDKDGKITKAETTAAGDKLFARLDANKDGTISIDDLPDRPL